MDGDKSGRWLLSDDRKVGGIFKDTRDKMREKGRKRKKRYVTFARELICDIYVYSILIRRKRKLPERTPGRILQARRLLHNFGVRQKQNYVHEKNTRVTVESSHSLGSRALENPPTENFKTADIIGLVDAQRVGAVTLA